MKEINEHAFLFAAMVSSNQGLLEASSGWIWIALELLADRKEVLVDSFLLELLESVESASTDSLNHSSSSTIVRDSVMSTQVVLHLLECLKSHETMMTLHGLGIFSFR